MGDATNELLLRLVDRFISHTQIELDKFIAENKNKFYYGITGDNKVSAEAKSECKAGVHRHSEESAFDRDVDTFLSKPSPTLAFDISYECQDKTNQREERREFELGDGKHVKGDEADTDQKRSSHEVGAEEKVEYTIQQYQLYEAYCSLFERSMLSALPEDQTLDSDELAAMLQRAKRTSLDSIEEMSDASLAAIFVEMVSALSDFEEFYYMMREAAEDAEGTGRAERGDTP